MLRKWALFLAAADLFTLGQLEAQNHLAVVDFGVRAGEVTTNLFQFIPLCCGVAAALGPATMLTSEGLHGTIGATAGVLLYNRVEVRFEAVHRRYGYQLVEDSTAGPFRQTITKTNGHLWEYPIFVTYHFSNGPVRPFAGAGVNLSGSSKQQTLMTVTSQQAGGAVVTTFFPSSASGTVSTDGLYVVAGVDGRMSYFSIRPEFRYTSVSKGLPDGLVRNPNQFEFLIGLSVHPFRSSQSPK